MKKFVLQNIAFAAILLSILTCIRNSVPYHFGNRIMEQKLLNVIEGGKQLNTFFVGSSKTHRHFDPKTFDRITNMNSFNLGNGGTFFLETHYLIENFLKDYPISEPTYVIFQNISPTPIAKVNLHSLDTKYFMDFKRLKIGVRHFWQQRNYTQIYYHFISYVENQLCIGQIKRVLKHKPRQNKKLIDSWTKNKGYYPLDKQLKLKKSTTLLNRRKLFNKKKSLAKYKKLFTRRLKVGLKELSSKDINLSIPNELVVLYKVKLTPTNTKRTGRDIFQLKPSLFFDIGHFNSKGARIFTSKVAHQFNSHLQN